MPTTTRRRTTQTPKAAFAQLRTAFHKLEKAMAGAPMRSAAKTASTSSTRSTPARGRKSAAKRSASQAPFGAATKKRGRRKGTGRRAAATMT